MILERVIKGILECQDSTDAEDDGQVGAMDVERDEGAEDDREDERSEDDQEEEMDDDQDYDEEEERGDQMDDDGEGLEKFDTIQNNAVVVVDAACQTASTRKERFEFMRAYMAILPVLDDSRQVTVILRVSSRI
jgi:hypothetical protein